MTLTKALETSKTAYRKDGNYILAYSEARPNEVARMSRGDSGTGSFQIISADRAELETLKDWTAQRP